MSLFKVRNLFVASTQEFVLAVMWRAYQYDAPFISRTHRQYIADWFLLEGYCIWIVQQMCLQLFRFHN